MDIIPPWIWFISGLGFLIAELITPTFFFGIVGVGALVASLFDLVFGFDSLSFATFVIASGGAAYLAKKFEIRSEENPLKSGVDRLIDRQGEVQERIESGEAGIVKVAGEKWRARSKYGEPIEAGAKVIVEEIEGTTLIVWQTEEPKKEIKEQELQEEEF